MAIALAAPLAAQSPSEFTARHEHWRRGCAGVLTFDATGIRFAEKGKRKAEHQFAWAWQDIQQLEIGDGRRVRVLSYHDRPLLAGEDQAFNFTIDGRPDLRPIYDELRSRLDQRFIARLADAAGTPQWSLPVKRLGALRGSEGTLLVFEDRVVYQSATTLASRTWRDADIQNISTSSPLEFSLTTLERNGTFHFQLKQTLDRERFDALWHRLNRPRGLDLIKTNEETKQ